VNSVQAWIQLIKPRIVLLGMATTYIGMQMVRMPDEPLPWILLLAVGLAGAGAAAWNQILDRHLDARMVRTRTRPLVRGMIRPGTAAVGATFLVGVGLVLAWRVHPFAFVLLALSVFLYTPVYTLGKRRDPYAAVYGSLIGALLPVVGVVGVRGVWTPEATWLFAVMFLWQPVHFWALGLMYREDYARAGIPVLPVVASLPSVKLQMAAYALALLGLGTWPLMAGWGAPALRGLPLVAGVLMTLSSMGLGRTPRRARWVFRYSLIYLVLVFFPWWMPGG